MDIYGIRDGIMFIFNPIDEMILVGVGQMEAGGLMRTGKQAMEHQAPLLVALSLTPGRYFIICIWLSQPDAEDLVLFAQFVLFVLFVLFVHFFASPDALEVMLVTESVMVSRLG